MVQASCQVCQERLSELSGETLVAQALAEKVLENRAIQAWHRFGA
jgi:hypothetical protein